MLIEAPDNETRQLLTIHRGNPASWYCTTWEKREGTSVGTTRKKQLRSALRTSGRKFPQKLLTEQKKREDDKISPKLYQPWLMSTNPTSERQVDWRTESQQHKSNKRWGLPYQTWLNMNLKQSITLQQDTRPRQAKQTWNTISKMEYTATTQVMCGTRRTGSSRNVKGEKMKQKSCGKFTVVIGTLFCDRQTGGVAPIDPRNNLRHLCPEEYSSKNR